MQHRQQSLPSGGDRRGEISEIYCKYSNKAGLFWNNFIIMIIQVFTHWSGLSDTQDVNYYACEVETWGRFLRSIELMKLDISSIVPD